MVLNNFNLKVAFVRDGNDTTCRVGDRRGKWPNVKVWSAASFCVLSSGRMQRPAAPSGPDSQAQGQ